MDGTGHAASFRSVYSDDIGDWKVVGTIDLNRDGIGDVLLQHSSGHWVGAWVMDAAGRVASFRSVYDAVPDWKVVGTADLNRDGITDILLHHASAHWVSAWLMDGAGRVTTFMDVYPDDIGDRKVVGTADLNRDGIDDILLQHSSAHWVSAWLMDGTGHPASFVHIYPDDIGDWKVVGTADLNRDGVVDLLMQHSSAHWVSAWLMDGTGHAASFMHIYPEDIGGWRVNGRD
jgi:hypothetical protein